MSVLVFVNIKLVRFEEIVIFLCIIFMGVDMCFIIKFKFVFVFGLMIIFLVGMFMLVIMKFVLFNEIFICIVEGLFVNLWNFGELFMVFLNVVCMEKNVVISIDEK